MEINIVPDQACPECGAFWGHPDPSLDFPNRPKVDNHWRCYNPECDVAFYSDGVVTERELPEDDRAAQAKAIREMVEAQIAGHGLKVTVHNADGSITDESLPPAS